MATITNGQTCLEKRGMEERHNEITRSDYNIENQYGPTHKDAIADGDVQGKGVGGQHSHWLPDCNMDKNIIKYDNFTTSPDVEIGGLYDIKGRNGIGGREWALASSLYNYEDPYTISAIDTKANINDGQYSVNQRIS